MLRIHDTMAGREVDFVPRVPGRASMYVCGPTVYDVPHIGHGRTAIVFDVMQRYLEWSGMAVTYVSNVTNVDDRIIERAAREAASEQEVARALRGGVLAAARAARGPAAGRDPAGHRVRRRDGQAHRGARRPGPRLRDRG